MASAYVNMCVESISEFKEKYGEMSKSGLSSSRNRAELIDKCIANTIDSICFKYASIASDLLESVRKMEESMRKLQRVRKSSAQVSSSSSASNSAVSDDDKIRIQLYIDVVELEKLCAQRFKGYVSPNYDGLFKLVQDIHANIISNLSHGTSSAVMTRSFTEAAKEKIVEEEINALNGNQTEDV